MHRFNLNLLRKDDHSVELQISEHGVSQPLMQASIADSDIKQLLQDVTKDYQVGGTLAWRGEALYSWLDRHTNGWLRDVRHKHNDISLIISGDAGLRHLPWELLHDGTAYLCANSLKLFTPLRLSTPPEVKHEWQPQRRQLGVLFMASSPKNAAPVLDFEAEEAAILQATAKKPLDLQVEESGSLEGLAERLMEYREGETPDVIHLTGHADVTKDHQPVFLLEDEVGLRLPATPVELARTLRDTDTQPKLVFLSGCRTGQSDHQQEMLSFSEQLVEAGTPVVLGWALPVGDQAASQAAAVLYEKLATGISIDKAVAQARQTLLENHSPYWHLLRCYVDGSAPQPLVSKGRLRVRQYDSQQQFLTARGAGAQQIRVCSRQDFIGRRRLLQRCLRSLRSWLGDEAYAEGVLLHGMGGLGKSSSAARLVDRLRSSHEAVVCFGGLNETVLISALGKALPEAHALLNDGELSLEQRLRQLFVPEDNPYCRKIPLLVFDDFEQNIPLAQRKAGQATYEPEALRILNTVLQAIHHGGSDARVIVTSRFEVPVAAPCRLQAENPQTLHAADLDKKLAQLSGFKIPANAYQADKENALQLREQALAIAAGNPRLLEWLDKVLLEKDQLPVADLFARLEGEEARFREDILLADLVKALTSTEQRTLACAALYELPMGLAAIEVLTEETETAQQLQKAARTGLVEINRQTDGDEYFVSGLLDGVLADVLFADEREALAARASRYLFELTQDGRPEAMGLEIVRLAVVGKEREIAVGAGHILAYRLNRAYRYREAKQLCQQILSLGDDFRVVTTLARVEQSLGDGQTAFQQIERAVKLTPTDKSDLSDGMLKETAITSGIYADILQDRGQIDEALRIRREDQLSVYEQLGDVRSKAVTMGKIADILQARGQIDEALRIRREDQLPVFEQLGDVREKAVTMGRIAGILQARGQLDEALRIRREDELPVYEQLGDVRPKAVTMGQIADILQARGQIDEALRIRREDQLPVFEQLGDVRSKAVTMGQVADILQARGQTDEALRIRREEVMPSFEQLGDPRLVAVEKGKIADILQARGQLDEALRIRREDELPVYEQLGDVQSLLVGRTNLAMLLWQMDAKQNAAEVQELLSLALSDAQRLQLPEAAQIEGIMQQMGLSNDNSEKAAPTLEITTQSNTVNRNAPCACNSGKRYKHCCGTL